MSPTTKTTKTLLPLLLSLAAASCGSPSSPPPSTKTTSTALEGTYYSPTSDVFRWISFDGGEDHRFASISPPETCGSSCEHRGTFTRTNDDVITLHDEVTNIDTVFQLKIDQVEDADDDGSLIAPRAIGSSGQLVESPSTLLSRATQFTMVAPPASALVSPDQQPIVVAGTRLRTYYAICLLAIGQVLGGVGGADVPDPIPDPPALVQTTRRCKGGASPK